MWLSRTMCLSAICVAVAACSTRGSDSALDDAALASSSEIALLMDTVNPEAVSEVDWAQPISDVVWASVLQSPVYRRSLATSRVAISSIDVARSARRPQASLNLQGGSLREIGGAEYSGVFGGATISQLILDGGASAASVDAASAEALAAVQEVEGAANAEALASSVALLQHSAAARRLALLDGRVAELDELLGQVERMAQSGVVNSSALDSARRQLLDIQMERARLLEARDASRRDVVRRFGGLPPEGLDVSGLDAFIPPAELGDAWALAPDVVGAAANLVGAQAELRRSQAAFFPRASLQSRYNSPIQENDNSDVSVGLAVEYVIGSGGRRVADVERAEAAVSAAQAALEAARDNLNSELGNLQSQISLAANSIALLEERVRLLSDELDSSRSQIVTGQVSLGQLIESEVALYRALDQLIQYNTEHSVAKLTLTARLGLLYAALSPTLDGE